MHHTTDARTHNGGDTVEQTGLSLQARGAEAGTGPYSGAAMPLNKLLQLLRRSVPPRPTPASPAPAPFEAPEAPAVPRLDRLDLQAAVIHHLEWCVQFNDHLGQIRPGEPPLVRTLPHAADSALGQWLQAAATRPPGQHPLFASLLDAHRHFHELAEEAIELATEDRMDLASTLLNTDFERARKQVLGLLRDMQKG